MRKKDLKKINCITRTCLNAVPWSATKHRHASLRTRELYRAHNSINLPILSRLTICAAAPSQRRPKSDSKNSFDNSNSVTMAALSHLFKSVTAPAI